MTRSKFKISVPIFLAACSLAFTSCTRSNPSPDEGTRESSQSDGGGLNAPGQVGVDQQSQAKNSVSSSVAIPTTLKFTLAKVNGGSVVFTSEWDGKNTRSQINDVLLK